MLDAYYLTWHYLKVMVSFMLSATLNPGKKHNVCTLSIAGRVGPTVSMDALEERKISSF
jgi:hypothetical protein